MGRIAHPGLVRPGLGQHQPLCGSVLSEALDRETWHAGWPEALLTSSRDGSKLQKAQTTLLTDSGQTGANQRQRTRKSSPLGIGLTSTGGRRLGGQRRPQAQCM